MTKFSPKFIQVTQNPVLIVGEKPGNTRDGSTFALVGNRTGDFVAEAIQGIPNIILTNVVNLQYKGNFNRQIGVADGILDLIDIIEEYDPRRIICLGNIALEYVSSIRIGPERYFMPHPSWINRFRFSERSHFIKQLRNEVNK